MTKKTRREDKAGYILNWRTALQYDARVTPSHYAVGMAYSDFPNYHDGKGARPTQVTVAAISNLTDKTVAKCAADLEAWGYMVPVGTLKANVQEYNLTVPASIVVYASLAGRCPFEDRHQVIDEPAKYKQRRRVQSIERAEVAEPVSEPQEVKQETEVKQPETEPQKPVQRSEMTDADAKRWTDYDEWSDDPEPVSETAKPTATGIVHLDIAAQRDAEVKGFIEGSDNPDKARSYFLDAEGFHPEVTNEVERARKAHIEVIGDKPHVVKAQASSYDHDDEW